VRAQLFLRKRDPRVDQIRENNRLKELVLPLRLLGAAVGAI
jgi:hypothetical protein